MGEILVTSGLTAAGAPPPEGARLVKASELGMKLEVDTERHDIAQVIAALVQRLPIADITIEDPPMEEIIAAIYAEAPGPAAGSANG